MGIVTTVVIYNYQNFNSTTLVTNYAYEVAFAIKEAQVYGLSVLGGSDAAAFQRGYGIHFDKDSLGNISTATFILFADRPLDSSSPVGDGVYISGQANDGSPVKTYSFSGRYKVDTFCTAVGDEAAVNCGDATHLNKKLDITFVRPNPDARIIMSEDGGVTTGTQSRAEITIISPQGKKKKIVVYSTGQISIPQDVPTP